MVCRIGEPVHYRITHHGVAEKRPPVSDRSIRCQDHRLLSEPSVDDRVETFCRVLINRFEAEVVNHKDVYQEQAPDQGRQAVLQISCCHIAEELMEVIERYGEHESTGLMSKCFR